MKDTSDSEYEIYENGFLGNITKLTNDKPLETAKIKKVKIKRFRDQRNDNNIVDSSVKEKAKKKKKKKKKGEFKIEGEKESFDNKDNFIIESKNRKRIIPKAYVKYILKSNKLIYLNSQLYKFYKKRGYFKALSKHECEVLISESIKDEHDSLLVDYDITSIFRLIKIQPDIQFNVNDIPENDMLINCKNLVVDLKNGEEFKHDSEYYFLNCINAKYKNDFDSGKFRLTEFYKFINIITQGNKELIRLIQEIIGYSISNINNAKKFFIFYGVPNSGKSTLLDLIEYIVGEENTSNIPLQKLNDDKYVAELYNKLLNIYNELPDEGLGDLGQIKALVSSNDKVNSRKLYNSPFSFKNKATLIFATNNMPELKTKLYQDNTAFFNRVIIVPFLNSISEEKQDKYLFEKLKSEINYIFTWAIIGIRRYIGNGYKFSECDISKCFLERYKNDEDLINTFINEKITINEDNYVFFSEMRESFAIFCKDNGKSHINSKEYKYLKESIEIKFKIKYKKIHKNNENKWGFKGITIG